jgi:hypothetical protein
VFLDDEIAADGGLADHSGGPLKTSSFAFLPAKGSNASHSPSAVSFNVELTTASPVAQDKQVLPALISPTALFLASHLFSGNGTCS